MSDENLDKEKYQKIEKIITRIFIAFIIVFAIIICFVFWLSLKRTVNIKTEYGDEFKVVCGDWGDTYWIEDKNSGFWAGLDFFGRKKDFHSVCDNQYFRCYHIENTNENSYIFKIKKYDEFFIMYILDEYDVDDLHKDDTLKIKSELLCDSTLMKICLPALDSLYHDELTEMGKRFVNRDFDGLGKYGLTEDMINDTESLEEKIQVMNHYLRKKY